MSKTTVQRAVEYTVRATRFGPTNIPGKEHWRIIGTTDIDGKGTSHALASLDPFIFLDESLNPAGFAGLGGGGHPHAGLTAITYLNPSRPKALGASAHGALQPWDNVGGVEQPINHAGGVYVIASGRGVVHDERNITEQGCMHQFQLWVDPGHSNYEGSTSESIVDSNLNLPMAHFSLHPPQDVPIATGTAMGDAATDGAWCRVIIGSQFGLTSPAATPVPGGMLYLHLSLPPSGTTSVTIPRGFRGISYVVEGQALVGATRARLGKRDAAVLSPDAGTGTGTGTGEGTGDSDGDSKLLVANPGGEELQLLVAAGAPQHSGPLRKVLGHGGAIFARDEDAARGCMRRFEANPHNFGKEERQPQKL